MKKRVLALILGLATAVLLVAVAVVVVPIVTHQSAGSSGQNIDTTTGSTVTATGDDARTRTLTATDETGNPANLQQLRPGDIVRVKGAGYDAGIGIYVSFCKLPSDKGERPGPCLGDVPASKERATAAQGELSSSAWVTDDFLWAAFATTGYSNSERGEFAVTLVVPEVTGNGVNCRVEKCALVTRADHTASGDRVQDLALPIRFAE